MSLTPTLRKANQDDAPKIWDILSGAVQLRKEQGSAQWQDGYPNPQTIQNDIALEQGYVYDSGNELIGYVAIILNTEPDYDDIEGQWQSDGDFYVIHRLAISGNYGGKGLATDLLKEIEAYAVKSKIFSIRADTNYDNAAMLKIFKNLNYVYCGEVNFRGSARKAFEKLLK
ncbi:GNAT family N-acetyltransferase [Chryseobacterium sp. cx-311]|uniref:GNAT family N-acetyltransferase n=1 Tax=Marnyiella aurantia TaxID=2758037 RepID=UPI001AE354DE|nr:GNAT family N-acetyltransferase [Marnyiella aurantia]MBP0613084.1 GNAT family N-acetyltransferase [Marnyiella aurantia]